MPSPATYMTADEAALVLRITPFAVMDLCKAGRIVASKPGRSWLITPADLDAYIASGSNQKAAS